MRRILVLLSVTGALATVPLAAQDSTPTPRPPDSTHTDSTPPPTPEQQRWMQGLRTAARGIGQIKSGIEGVQRVQGSTSATQIKKAGKLLAGYCGTARGFMRTGVARMSATAYTVGDNRTIARQVVTQIDSVIRESTTCEQQAAHDAKGSVDRLVPILRSYETAIAAWRAMVGLPPLPPTRPPTR
ncbi:MAG TPA: hypothetical protein VNX15_03805 [Gemmatimonadales bacterium]|jgi:hypothetical protein|nr:hypothetical protein [Gemmatimonadales bacterium]